MPVGKQHPPPTGLSFHFEGQSLTASWFGRLILGSPRRRIDLLARRVRPFRNANCRNGRSKRVINTAAGAAPWPGPTTPTPGRTLGSTSPARRSTSPSKICKRIGSRTFCRMPQKIFGKFRGGRPPLLPAAAPRFCALTQFASLGIGHPQHHHAASSIGDLDRAIDR